MSEIPVKEVELNNENASKQQSDALKEAIQQNPPLPKPNQEEVAIPVKKTSSTVQVDKDDLSAHEGDYYLSGLFNIETSPGYRALDNLKTSKNMPEEKYFTSILIIELIN